MSKDSDSALNVKSYAMNKVKLIFNKLSIALKKQMNPIIGYLYYMIQIILKRSSLAVYIQTAMN